MVRKDEFSRQVEMTHLFMVAREKRAAKFLLRDLGYASENKEEAAMLALLKAKPALHLTAWW